MTRFNLDIFDTTVLFFSWYVKPAFLNESFFSNLQFFLLTVFVTLIILVFSLGCTVLNPLLNAFYTIKLTSYLSIFMGLKFVVLIGLLIVVRGGIPRYRYDFLTKLGWIKTLSLSLAIFLINLLMSYL